MMEKFILTYDTKFEDNLFKIRVYPLDYKFSNLCESWINQEVLNQHEIDLFILDQTPKLFSLIQQMESISQELKNQFEL
jgi:hypothetical protein